MGRKAYRTLSEDDVIRQAQEGDASAFSELVRRYEDTVFKFSYKVCRNQEKAEETLQDTFINVYKKLSSFDGKSKFSTWVYTIVTNNCLMHRRRRKRLEVEEPLEAFDQPPGHGDGRSHREFAQWDETPVDIMLNKELQHTLNAAILKLSKDYRVVFVMRDIEGKSNEETAQILGLSVEATKSRLRRARAFLREQLHPYMTATGGGQS